MPSSVPARRRTKARASTSSLAVTDALGAMFGAALVCDWDRRLVLATREAAELLGFVPEVGAFAPNILCGSRSDRPVAEALARGEAVEALIPCPNAEARGLVRVRAVPVGPRDARTGWILLLEWADDTLGHGVVDLDGFVTGDAATKQILRVVERVAAEEATVLIRGETGTGKDLIARALHQRSPRRAGPFRALNCAALPPSLLESELFGHARGAFTGAIRDMPGHIQLAHGGTLFLDEVAELPLELQAKLLRTLETRTVIPVGAREPIPVDARIVSATHRSLRAEVAAGRFRSDLMYRLRVVPIHLPPLRARPGDVAILVARIVAELTARGRRRVEHVAEDAMQALLAFDYPGNVRELRNLLEYAFAVGEGPILLASDLPPGLGDGPDEVPAVRVADEAESASLDALDPATRAHARRLRAALERAGGNRERAAAILGISRVTLWRQMRELTREHPGILPV